jgi:hypothetical protein
MNTALWILQTVLAFKFLSTAYTHLFRTDQPQWRAGLEKMGARARLVLTVSGVCAALLILPAATGILPWLTPLAAALLALLMLRGVLFHVRCRAKPNVWAALVLIVLCAVVAYARWVVVPL